LRKLTLILTASTLLLGTMAMQASAQNQHRGAASIHMLKNATPIVIQRRTRRVLRISDQRERFVEWNAVQIQKSPGDKVSKAA
jgi:hypothetical protein